MVGVAGEDDPAADRDLRAGEAVRIALAVPALVLVADDPRHVAQTRDRAQDALADRGVLAHDLPLAIGQGPGLCRISSGTPTLPMS